jgi:hypothetical protein
VDDGLRTYLNDQLAMGILWREVARRAQRRNDGTDLGEALASVAAAIAQCRGALVAEDLVGEPNGGHQSSAAWTACGDGEPG